MRLSRSTAMLISILLSFPILACAQNGENPWNFPDFSATQVFPSPQYERSTKVFRSGTSVRSETTSALATLFTLDTNKAYNLTVYPGGSSTCVVGTPDQAMGMPSPLSMLFGTNVKRVLVGREVVEGHNSRVETVVVTRNGG